MRISWSPPTITPPAGSRRTPLWRDCTEARRIKGWCDTYEKLLCICLLLLLCLPVRRRGSPLERAGVFDGSWAADEQLQVLHSGPRTCTHPSLRLKSRKRRMSCSACRCPISIIASSRRVAAAPCAGSIAWLRRQANPAAHLCSRQVAYQRSLSYLL